MKLGNLKSFADSKRVKYGTLNIILIALVIAIVIMLNSIITVLSNTFGFYLDMTEEQLYTVSEPLVELLKDVSSDVEIDIIFCCDKDQAQKSYSNLENGGALAYVHSTATQIAEKLDNVSLVYKDPVKDYEFMRTFTTLSSQIKPTESTVIVARKDANGNYGTFYRTYHASSFYTFASMPDGSSALYGYRGERQFATAILSLTQDKTPTVYFVTGHSEDIPYSTEEGYNIPALASTYMDCGFAVRYINLSDKQFSCETNGCDESWGYSEVSSLDKFTCELCNKEYRVKSVEFNEDRQIPQNARAIIINQPESDYTSDELVKLSNYLTLSKGTILCFVDPIGENVPVHPLKNLYSFIKQETGVTILDSDVVKDSSTTSIGADFDFRGNIANNYAAKTYLSALQNFGAAKPILNNSGILDIDERYSQTGENGNGFVEDRVGERYTLPLVQTSSGASFNGNVGKHTVMSVTSVTTIKENENTYSYMVVCPSASFIDVDYMNSNVFPNYEIMLALIHSTSNVNVPVNLDFKTFADYELDITQKQATTTFVCLVTIMPLLVSAIGVVVIVRRKNR
ncbi:MAG: Gldg family protein [Clostridia bacterium]|nr:Gldg family protein [Clostridia bacterium]